MKTMMTPLLCAGLFAISGCSAMYPQTREAFVDTVANYDGMMKDNMVNISETLTTPYERAVANVESQMQTCISTSTSSRRVTMSNYSTISQQNRPSFTRVSSDRAELTLQQWHSGMFGQPENGLYLLAADLIRSPSNTTQLDIYSSKQFTPVIEAVGMWAKGGKDCYGVGGE